MIKIAFLALTPIHQYFHWLPAALRLAREPGVEVTVLSASRAQMDFIRRFDPDRTLKFRFLFTPTKRIVGLFTPPKRRKVMRLWGWLIARYPFLVATETFSAGDLKRYPWRRARIIEIKHGMGDRAKGYIDTHKDHDFIIVAGEKDKQRLVERGLIEPENCVVTGYAKFEMIRPPERLFDNDKPIALYNPHFDPDVSSFWIHGSKMIDVMNRIDDWNFVVAPHVKLRPLRGPLHNKPGPNVIVDRASVRSMDMTYTQSASVYIGDASSQVYEFIRTPRPCIFLNSHRVDWKEGPAYSHWHFGQVIETPEELPAALARAAELQPGYEAAQREYYAWSNKADALPASERQAHAILDFIARSNG